MKNYIHFITILVAAFSLSQCQPSHHKNQSEGLPGPVIASIEKRIEEGIHPGIAIAIINQNGTQYFNFGKTAESGQAVDEHTIFEIGSISKVFTGILLGQQVLEGDLKLDAMINEYLPPEVQVPVMGNEEITFAHLSDHTSGIPRMPGNFSPANPANPYADYTVAQMYEFISNYEPVRAVGTEYEYSNLAQGLLGHLLAVNKNTTYEDLMVQNIAKPLEMNETKIELDQRMRDNLAPGHSGGKVVENWDIPTLAGAGGIRSSASDMAKFISANLGYPETSILSAMELSHQVRHDKAGNMSVALGWHIMKGDEGDVIWHNGGTGGYRAFAGFVKETGKGVVVLTNSSTDADDIGFHLLNPGSELKKVKSKNNAVEVSEAILEQYIGVYELQPDFTITISREGSQLFAQATGQDRFEIYASSDTVFYLTVAEAEVSFQIKNDIVESLTLFQGGQVLLGKKVE